ncbi:MAG: hypothetical protein AB7O67_02220 [Vicinamibacterales bacterium]
MRRLALVLLTMVVVRCGPGPGPGQPPPGGSADVPLEYLLTSAAADFHRNRQPYPAAFRDVSVRVIAAPDGSPQHMLCGRLLPAGDEVGDEWVPFVTIKTSGYEQMLGAQATALCDKARAVPPEADLSADLARRLHALE